MRSEVDDDAGVRRWLSVLLNHAEFDVPASELESLAALMRRIDPSWLQNVVMPGKIGSAGSQSVVYPTEAAAAMWGDLRDDVRLDGATSGTGGDPGGGEGTPTTYPEDTTTTEEPATTTTTRPPVIIGGGGTTTTTTTPPDGF